MSLWAVDLETSFAKDGCNFFICFVDLAKIVWEDDQYN